ncbi:MAG: acyloxyacyl hydrolase [Chitinophagaceae bacterium]|nr:acyloxyacyl hydrolase [Chitinophagaceae bacterium]
MIGILLKIILIISFLTTYNLLVLSQDSRAQYPSVLKKAYFGVSAGYINYRFSSKQLEQGYTAESVSVPHFALRVILFGYRFNDHLSAQVSYMRPAAWIKYKNVNGSRSVHEVGMNVAGLTLRSGLPVSKKITFISEAGVAVVTRSGFIIGNAAGVKDAGFTSLLVGAGMSYRLSKNWELNTAVTWSPAYEKAKQPATIFYSTGFHYNMRPLPGEKVQRNSQSRHKFSKRVIQAGYTTNAAGYGVNNLFSQKIPVFWGGDAQVKSGISLQYQHNIFHGRGVFSLDWGATAGWWKSDIQEENFVTFALFPVFRFTIIRVKTADLYFNYSLGGPAFISRTLIDGHDTGKKFTFQDIMGIGVFAGRERQLNAEFRIVHYSNGNIFPHNDGVKIPLTFSLGYSVK